MMDLEKLIAEAWEQERARYVVYRPKSGPHELHLDNEDGETGTIVLEGNWADCERHLSALCARAVMRAMKEAGMAVYDYDTAYGYGIPDLFDKLLGVDNG